MFIIIIIGGNSKYCQECFVFLFDRVKSTMLLENWHYHDRDNIKRGHIKAYILYSVSDIDIFF